MKSALAGLGLGALVCLPCVFVVVGGIGVLAGVSLLALAQQPLALAAGAFGVIGGVAAIAAYARRRASTCEDCELERRRGGAVFHHEVHN